MSEKLNSKGQASEDNWSSTRQKRSIEDDLTCSITLELPFDPVTAEDGRVYDRWAIEQYFESTDEVVSPITKQVIGKKLLPAVQHKNQIEFLLEKGLISGDLADKWNEKVKEKKEMDELLEKAEAGDVAAMELLGHSYCFGWNGFQKDHKKSFAWYDRARQAGSVKGTARVGEALVLGLGVEKNIHKGTMYLGIAAGQGSDLAAFYFGKGFAKGFYGAKIDKSLAVHWLEKVISGECKVKELISLARARELLGELKIGEE